jgi:GNAT superfamily N-acetyltransferase
MTIRPMDADDLEAVAALCGQLGYPATPDHLNLRLSALRRGHDPGRDAVLVAEEDGAVVGWIQGAVRVTLEAGSTAEIVGLVVDRARRGRGIGGQLVRAVEAWARANNCARLRVRSRIERQDAHRFYDRAGFSPLKTQRVFDKLLGGDSV